MEASTLSVVISGGYLLFAEMFFRKDGSLDRDQKVDRGTTRWTGLFVFASIFLPKLLSLFFTWPVPLTPSALVTVLLLCPMLAGVGLRYWSMSVLAASFSRVLRVQQDQKLITSGPYSLIRHPGYAANALVFVPNAVLSASSWAAGLVWLALFLVIYHARISAEEAMLRQAMPEYNAYAHATKKLIPFVY